MGHGIRLMIADETEIFVKCYRIIFKVKKI